ncbi:MAG: hypothetical protein J6W19_10190 [Prevotella sp.]|nr:hypothetical protein [Prevotella sp.]
MTSTLNSQLPSQRGPAKRDLQSLHSPLYCGSKFPAKGDLQSPHSPLYCGSKFPAKGDLQSPHSPLYRSLPSGKVKGLIIDPMPIPYPSMLVNLTEHHFIILINHFAAKVTAVNPCFLGPSRIRHQAKQCCCNNHVSLHI